MSGELGDSRLVFGVVWREMRVYGAVVEDRSVDDGYGI